MWTQQPSGLRVGYLGFDTNFIICKIKYFEFVCLFQQKLMASFISKLETWLKCHICQGTVRQPKTLQCFHSFCEECVRQEVKTTPTGVEGVKCPECNAFTDKNEIKVNSLMCELLDVHEGTHIIAHHFLPFNCSENNILLVAGWVTCTPGTPVA